MLPLREFLLRNECLAAHGPQFSATVCRPPGTIRKHSFKLLRQIEYTALQQPMQQLRIVIRAKYDARGGTGFADISN